MQSYSGPTVIANGTLQFGGPASYLYYQFEVTGTQGGNPQMSELAFYSSGTNPSNGTRVLPISYTGGGTSNSGEDPGNLSDNNLSTKWYDQSGALPVSVTFQFKKAPQFFTGYDWATANDNIEHGRNPNNWTVLASNNGTTWTTLDTQTSQGGSVTSGHDVGSRLVAPDFCSQ